jgi:hypothetical protein
MVQNMTLSGDTVKTNDSARFDRFCVGLFLPCIVGCLSSFLATHFLQPDAAYFYETVHRDSLAFLITGPFIVLSLVLCVPWLRGFLQGKGMPAVFML